MSRKYLLDCSANGAKRADDVHIPLNDSEGELKYAKTSGELQHAVDLLYKLLRLPFFTHMSAPQQGRVIETLYHAMKN